jgi:hypothetical protein
MNERKSLKFEFDSSSIEPSSGPEYDALVERLNDILSEKKDKNVEDQ